MKNLIDSEKRLQHWTNFSVEELSQLYKSFQYTDVVMERWFESEPSEKSKVPDARRNGQRIPRKLHFTWKTDVLEDLPELFQKIQVKWKLLNPDWEIKIWTDKECDKLVRDFYPEYYFFYNDFQVTAEKSDIFRYLVLDKYGGVSGKKLLGRTRKHSIFI